MKSHSSSPTSPEASSKWLKSHTANPSPQLSNQFSIDNCCSAIISLISKHSISSIESGYENSMSIPPSSTQMRNANVTSPVFHQHGVPDVIPAHKDGNMSNQQKPQINLVQSNAMLMSSSSIMHSNCPSNIKHLLLASHSNPYLIFWVSMLNPSLTNCNGS